MWNSAKWEKCWETIHCNCHSVSRRSSPSPSHHHWWWWPWRSPLEISDIVVLRIHVASEVKCVDCFTISSHAPISAEDTCTWKIASLHLTVLKCFECIFKLGMFHLIPRFFCSLRAFCKSYIPISVPCCLFAPSIGMRSLPSLASLKVALARLWMSFCKRSQIGTQPRRFSTEALSCKTWRLLTRTASLNAVCMNQQQRSWEDAGTMWHHAFLFSLLRVTSIIVGASQIEANTTGSSRVRLLSRLLSLQIARTISQRRSWSNWQSTFEWICPCRLSFSYLFHPLSLVPPVLCLPFSWDPWDAVANACILRYVTKPEYTVEAVGNQSKAGLTFIVVHAMVEQKWSIWSSWPWACRLQRACACGRMPWIPTPRQHISLKF